LRPLEAITPIDGRYRGRVEELSRYFSEYALIKKRLEVEIKYLIELMKAVKPKVVASLPDDWEKRVEKIVDGFGVEEAERVKELERRLGHDVKALMTYLRNKLHEVDLKQLSPYIHLGLTSDDVNNLAYSILLKSFSREILIPKLMSLVEMIADISRENVDVVMLARTHGVPAIPTTFGRFLANYAYRLSKLLEEISSFEFPGKLGGAVGDHSALKLTYPDLDWMRFSREFVESLGLRYFPAATQILPHERISDFLMKTSILCSILSNLCRDLWILSSLGLLIFARKPMEAHSSTMPHKSNPIHLENAEGAFDLASSISSQIAGRLISSRLHRDLSDSIIERFYGLH